MRQRLFAAISILPIVLVWCASNALAGQTPTGSAVPKSYVPQRTADGQPNLQGVWDFR
jgi:hypothetical protein